MGLIYKTPKRGDKMAYSMDLRVRVVEAYENGVGTQAELGQLFKLGIETVRRWIRRKEVCNAPIRLPRGGGNPRRIGAIGEGVLLGLLERAPDATLQELAASYAWVTHMPMNTSVISHTLTRLGITRKKRHFFPRKDIASGSRNYARSSSKR